MCMNCVVRIAHLLWVQCQVPFGSRITGGSPSIYLHIQARLHSIVHLPCRCDCDHLPGGSHWHSYSHSGNRAAPRLCRCSCRLWWMAVRGISSLRENQTASSTPCGTIWRWYVSIYHGEIRFIFNRNYRKLIQAALNIFYGTAFPSICFLSSYYKVKKQT